MVFPSLYFEAGLEWMLCHFQSRAKIALCLCNLMYCKFSGATTKFYFTVICPLLNFAEKRERGIEVKKHSLLRSLFYVLLVASFAFVIGNEARLKVID